MISNKLHKNFAHIFAVLQTMKGGNWTEKQPKEKVEQDLCLTVLAPWKAQLHNERENWFVNSDRG